MHHVLYRVDSRLDDLPHATFEWEAAVRDGPMLCACGAVSPTYAPRPIEPELLDVPRGHCTFVPPVSIFAAPFLAVIRKHLRGFVTGRCFVAGPPRRLIRSHRTCYPVPGTELLVRAKGNDYYRCRVCGRLSAAWNGSKEFVLRDSLDDRRVYQNEVGTMYLAPELAESLDWSRFPDAKLVKVPVVAAPRDGVNLPEDAIEIPRRKRRTARA